MHHVRAPGLFLLETIAFLTHHLVVRIAHSLPSALPCYARSVHDWQTDDGQTEPLLELFVCKLFIFDTVRSEQKGQYMEDLLYATH